MAKIKDYPPYLDHPKQYKPQTNADRIRAMSDEELAEILRDAGNCPSDYFSEKCKSFDNCIECWLYWLKQPVKDGDNDG